MGRLLLGGVAGVILTIGAFAAANGHAFARASALEPRSLARAETIRRQLDARYRVLRGRGLAVTEATSTGVVESFTLLTPDLLETRIVPADNGIYYAVCPVRATCPYPARRFARPAAELVPRRLALELALRTFLETSADVVAVSLPTPRFILFVVEREELAREVDLSTLAKALDRDPSRALSSSLEVVVDRLTRPRVYVTLGLEPTLSGRDSLVAIPRWPTVGDGDKDGAPLTAAGSATALLSHAAATAPADEGEVGARMSGAEVTAPDGLIPRKRAATGASAYDVPARLNEVAHVYLLGIGEVRCPAQDEWEAYYGSPFAWGSTNLRDDYTMLAPFICEGAMGVGSSTVPLWAQAAGVWVLVHEALPPPALALPAQRGEGRLPGNRVLQGRGDALALHIRQTELFSWYRDGKCRAPLWIPPVP